MAASASASAPGSAERQARGGAALASGNAVSARFPRARVVGRAVRIRWAFGILFFFLTVNGGERIPT